MYWGIKRKSVEYIIYTLFWGVLFLVPLWRGMLGGADSDIGIDELSSYWLFLSPAFILFIVNNNMLMPLFLEKKRGRTLYTLLLICFIAIFYLFFLFYYSSAPKGPNPGSHSEKITLVGNKKEGRTPPHAEFERKMHPPKGAPKMEPRMRGDAPSGSRESFIKENGGFEKKRPRPYFKFLHISIFHPQNVQILLIVFVLAFNICVRLFFYTLRKEDEFAELERQKLKSELDYLKFQINPHFFMNTLNNIHALIDIDKEKAQSTILKLARMMQRVLSDSSATYYTLDKEIQFISCYIDLMSLRYTDALKIKASFPDSYNNVRVPSMLFVSFLENAFKHGVSYNTPSEIELSIDVVDGFVLFCCKNTIAKKNSNGLKTNSGIGVQNAIKRLSLLYGDNYSYEIKQDNYYNVLLKIPVKND